MSGRFWVRWPGPFVLHRNSGAAWTKVDGNLPDVPVNDLVIDPDDATDNTVYVATDSGVYASANATAGSATTWTVLQAGLPNSQVLSLRLNRASRTLVAATHGRGMWNIQLPTCVEIDHAHLALAGLRECRRSGFSAHRDRK